MINTVIFDLDGTLLNTLEDMKDSANQALSAHGLPERSIEEVRSFIGNGIRNLMLRCAYGFDFPDEAPEEFEDILEDYRNIYSNNYMNKTKPYEGIYDMLDTLKSHGIKMAVVSNKYDEAVKVLADNFFSDYMIFSCGARDDMPRKPAPDMMELVLNEIGSCAEESVYVGDSEVDIKTSAALGMKCISCLWGFRDREDLIIAGGSMFAETPADIAEFLL